MTINITLLLMAMALCAHAQSQRLTRAEIAKILEDPATRGGVALQFSSDHYALERVLLSLANDPPKNINVYELTIGLADAFASLRTKQAIPFLIKHIGLQRGLPAFSWLKSDGYIISRKPAVNALISIGPDSVAPLIQAYLGDLQPDDRLAVVFSLSKINNSETERILGLSSTYSKLEASWADAAIKKLKSEK